MADDTVLIEQLEDALAIELSLVQTLTAHIAMTPAGRHRDLLERHLKETAAQADALRRRLDALGATRSPLVLARGAIVSLLGQAVATGKAPVDLLRGPSGEEKMLKNARDEVASEALEIATSDALEALAEAAGDTETADLARRHREEEQRTLDELRELLPELARDVHAARVEGEPRFDVTTVGVADLVRRGARFVRGAGEEAGERVEDLEEHAGEALSSARDRAEEAAEAPDGDELPIAGYDALSVQDVLPKLEPLSGEQLARLDAYERTGRNRKTVTDRIKRLRERNPAVAPQR